MHTSILIVFIALSLSSCICAVDLRRERELELDAMHPRSADGSKLSKGKKNRVNPQKVALEQWAYSLTQKDYNYTEWRIMYHSKSTVDFFNGYARKLSDLFKLNKAKVNFAMIGKLSKFIVYSLQLTFAYIVL